MRCLFGERRIPGDDLPCCWIFSTVKAPLHPDFDQLESNFNINVKGQGVINYNGRN